jgi:2-keto-4-pentenoate hydratase/2-oxohepta-3-ene-1,7-dioic acid hydratase in catechol pathway
LFLKSNTSVIGAGERVKLPKIDRRMDHEVEVAAVIGRECYHVAREQALDMVCGYTIALDMSVRGPEDRCVYRKIRSAILVMKAAKDGA